MKSLDAFGRPVQEFQVKTTCGGYLSVCSLCLIATLFVTELRYFLQLETRDEMVIDQNQDQKHFNVSLNITFPRVPCSVLSMNLLDPKKANMMHVATEIYETRLSSTGRPIGQRVREGLVNVVQTVGDLSAAGSQDVKVRTTHATTHLRCHSCYQSHIDEDDCCDTCEDVRRAFTSRGLSGRPADYVFSQCIEEAYAEVPAQDGEGCHLDANLHVRKVPATLHIGVGRYFRQEFLKATDPEAFLSSMDFSHTLERLSFGPAFPGLVPVLDGREKSAHKAHTSEHYQYDLHVIPTRYKEDGNDEIVSHQYSVTEYAKPVDVRQSHQDHAILGLWLNYDFTPFEVKVTSSRKSLWHFLTECCAILGGIFAFTGMLDNFAYQLDKSLGARGVRSARSEL